jgi:26S proteasome regulatory subunit N6
MAQVVSERVREAPKTTKESLDSKSKEEEYKAIISKPPSLTSDASVREYETALLKLGELYRDQRYISCLTPTEAVLTRR